MSEPRFSVVMATYNRGRHILPSIRSVLAQTRSDLELLVVGDHCTDDTAELVSGLADPRLRWLNLETRCGSQSFPNNAGIAAARGEIIAYLGHDDIWTPDHLAAMAALFDARPGLDWAVTGSIGHMPPGVTRPEVTGLFDNEDADAARRHFFPPSSVAHRRDLTDRIGPWQHPMEIGLPVDQDLQARAARAGLRFASTGRVTVHKFAAGHRYLSYLRHESQEQEDVLRRLAAPGYDRWVEELLRSARRAGSFMAVGVPPDPDAMPKGQWARQNAERKASGRVPVTRLDGPALLPVREGHFALDWRGEPERGFRWSYLNPCPKILLPFVGEGQATVVLCFAHIDPRALAGIAVAGRAVQLGQPRKLAGGLHVALATTTIDLDAAAPSVLELRLEGTQRPASGEPGLGLGSIVVAPGPAPSGLEALALLPPELLAMGPSTESEAPTTLEALRREVTALRASTSWRLTRPLRALAERFRALRQQA